MLKMRSKLPWPDVLFLNLDLLSMIYQFLNNFTSFLVANKTALTQSELESKFTEKVSNHFTASSKFSLKS